MMLSTACFFIGMAMTACMIVGYACIRAGAMGEREETLLVGNRDMEKYSLASRRVREELNGLSA